MIQDYVQARKLGMDAIKKAQKDGTDSYLQVLDNMEEAKEAHGNIKLSLIEIPLSRVVGTKTEGRNNAFAFNFMPLLEQSTHIFGICSISKAVKCYILTSTLFSFV